MRAAEWETYEHHKNLPNLPNFQELLDVSKPCFAGAPTIFHVPFNVPADGAFDAPVTEFCFAKLKNAEQRTEVLDLIHTLTTGFEKAYGPAVGTTREDSNLLGLVIGWDSVKVCCPSPDMTLGLMSFIVRNRLILTLLLGMKVLGNWPVLQTSKFFMLL